MVCMVCVSRRDTSGDDECDRWKSVASERNKRGDWRRIIAQLN